MPDERFNFDDDSPASEGSSDAQTPPPPPREIPQQGQPLVLAVLVFLSVASLVFGGVTIAHNVTAPFKGNGVAQANPTPSLGEDTNTAGPSDETLKASDTDEDGLSDYDELRIHHTSPYLKDTDSDGFGDKEEIASGHDPICPAGKTCASPQPLTSNLEPQTLSPQPLTSNLEPQTSPDPFSQLESATPAQVRAFLLEKGMPQDKLSQLSDDSLMQLYRQTLQEVKSQTPNLPSQPQTSNLKPQTFALPPLGANGPTPDQLRQVLRESGQVTEEQLKQLSDEALLDLYQKAIEKQKQQAGT